MAVLRRYVLVQLLWIIASAINIVSANYTNWYHAASLDALHSLQAAWNNTPNPGVNLRYWNASDSYPCWTEGLPTFAPWRGVQCLRSVFTNTSDNHLTGIVSDLNFNRLTDLRTLVGIISLTIAHNLNQQGKFMDLVDPKLKLRGNEIAEAQRVMHTALLCLQYSDEMRPLMSRVVNLLQGDASSESDISVDQPGHGIHTGIPAFDNVPASGSTDGSEVSQPNQ